MVKPLLLRNAEGVGFLVMAIALYSLVDGSVKWLDGRYAALEVVFFRSLFAFLPLSVAIWRQGGLRCLKTAHPGFHLVRGLLGLFAMLAFFIALPRMAFSDAIAISYAAPLFITLLSYPVLGERVGPKRWAAVCIGLIGVGLIFRPGTGLFQWIALAPLASAFSYALFLTLARRYGNRESTIAMAFYFTVLSLAASGLALPWVWHGPSGADLWVLMFIGIGAGLANLSTTHAFRIAEPSLLAPFEYFGLVFAVILGVLVWAEVPDMWMIAGGSIIVGSGLYIVVRETRRWRDRQTKTVPAAPYEPHF